MAGNDPLRDDITLTRGADFVHTYQPAPGDPAIPSGTTARIEITETSDTDAPIVATWAATEVNASMVRFKIESEVADLIEKGFRYRLMVRMPDAPDLDLCWYYGKINRKQ